MGVVGLAGDGELVEGHGLGTATDLASGAGGFQAGHRALADQWGVSLGQGSEDVEDEPTSGGGVDPVVRDRKPTSRA